ncbi:uncharacterized protein LOC142235442 [Haematobia irritans]|uniref:uncharacterized protein LOC142235442 n=1 Tax=Haematobia irritans TaxID=7368 RepID=UPI003F50BBB0
MAESHVALVGTIEAFNIESNFTYDQIIQRLESHFKPKKNVIMECFKFFKKEKSPSETISDYIVELKQLSVDCEFGSFLDKALLIKFVWGLCNEGIQNRLLNDNSLTTFDKACDLALSLDMTQSQVEMMKNNSIHRLKTQRTNMEVNKRESTLAADKRESRMTGIKCFYCNKRGHIERNCWIKKNDENGNKRNRDRRGKNKQRLNNIDDTSSSDSDYLNNL